ncbi:hypothetical protein IMG5_117480 [Ichthyophthirius multifiliis]|uniref:2,4-dienoyl-CoA reductase [(3E)-enoyl-CoA-producing] n=1 Tax=Ichthyophthirius multifiliis TaxID=5932 RepID=G0QUI6_ICHMU|nr:hypothetical protein IMG5_117480 [Ichthyophthirius multifiliis]EGR31106.1 hypothetical protein IMG5_117480 [Ichthyophthirius multifiliis]|eukprot:XP_004034592.1 hypothetical protein IMG5_117480 [Ichthyophthirius multifiliis]
MSIFQQNLFTKKVVLVTGGATGICYIIAQQFLKHGATVCIMSRKQKNINEAIELLKKEANSNLIYGTTCDVRKLEEIEKAVEFFIQKAGNIDILVNGAAGNFLIPFEKLSPNAFRTVIDIDLLGTFLVSKVVYSKCFKGKGGNIINISALLQICGVALQTHAGAAKAGVDAMTRHLAIELGPQNVRVNGIAPGSIDGTAGFEKLMPGNDLLINIVDVVPLNRLGNKEDIANCALFLASEAASYITGQIIVVDGGAMHTFPNFTLLSAKIRDSLKSKL